MASLRNFVRHTAFRNVAVDHLLTESPKACTSYSECHLNTPVSVDLSSVMYSPEMCKFSSLRLNQSSVAETPKARFQTPDSCYGKSANLRESSSTIRQRSLVFERVSHETGEPPKISSLSDLSTLNGTYREGTRTRNGPVNSTFIHTNCIQVLNFNEINTTWQSDDNKLNTTCNRPSECSLCPPSTGYSSGSSNAISQCNLPTAPPSSPVLSDSGVFEKRALGRRPECIGKEASPKLTKANALRRHLKDHSRITTSNEISMMSIDSDTSSFMSVPLFQHAISNGRTKNIFIRRLRQFKKHFRHAANMSTAALKFL